MTNILEASGWEMALIGHKPFLSFNSFALEQPGVYTLDGANGSGKSMFLRLLTGTLPSSIDQQKIPEIKVDGQTTPIASYRDALKHGITAVFQDDDLISSMTTSEYLLLAHSTTNPIRPLEYIWAMFHTWLVAAPLDTVAPTIPHVLRDFLERLKPTDTEWTSKQKLLDETQQLLKKHDVDDEILNKLTPRISGGARAATRIVSAQLRKRTRVLLLDEAFNSVEANVWPRFVDSIKEWAESHRAVGCSR